MDDVTTVDVEAGGAGPLGDFDRYLADSFDDLVEDLGGFVRIPGLSADGSHIGDAAGFVEERMRQAGFTTRLFETPGHPVVLGEAGPDDAPFTLLMYGHYDVFPAEGQAGWDTPPFEPTLRGDRLYGRGTGDNKGQLLAHLHALRWLAGEGGGLGVKVKFLAEGEEEIGSPSLPGFVDAHRDLLAADLCCYSDGPMFPGDQPILVFGVRGLVGLELRARGANRPLHSGNFGGVVPSPALDLARFLATVADPAGLPTLPGAGTPPLGPEERRALARLPLDLERFEADVGVPPVTGDDPVAFYERLLCRPVLNVTGIGAGHVGDGIRTLIPDEAVAKVDVRIVGDQDPDAVVAAVQAHARTLGYGNITVAKVVGQPASRTPVDHPLAEPVEAAVAEGFGRPPLRVPSLGATTPDYVFTKLLGLPSIVVPYAPHDERNHAPNESTKLPLYRGGMRTTVGLLTRLAALGGRQRAWSGG